MESTKSCNASMTIDVQFHSKDANLVQQIQINKCNIPCKLIKGQKWHESSVDP